MKCEICHVNVAEQNMYRHLRDVHPKHPDTEKLSKKSAARPPRQKVPISGKTKKIVGVVLAASILIGLAVVFGPSIGVLPNQYPFPCVTASLAYHWHTQLTISDSSGNVVVPAQIGIAYNCMEPIHTHDTSGTIHIESATSQEYTIGDFFKVWNHPFGTPSQMTVNGAAITPTASQKLTDQETIALVYSGGF